MNWYKCSNGNLLNLDHAVAITAELNMRRHGGSWIVKVHFNQEDFTFPDGFATREAAVQFIAELYEEMAV